MFNFFKKTDAQIEKDIVNEINWDVSISSTSIDVSVKDGIATLRGSVPHYYEKSQAEIAAQRVGGVRAVVDEMTVNLMGSYEHSDEQLAEAALNALKWSYSAPKNIMVTIEKGWVTLQGEADWDYQRIAAKTAVKQLMGVTGVTNKITIKSRSKPEDIKSRIEAAIKRAAESEGRNISVIVEGDRVTLQGNVHSFSEFEVARNAAWMAPGIMSVDNKLTIAQ